jgi:hypothetical protein
LSRRRAARQSSSTASSRAHIGDRGRGFWGWYWGWQHEKTPRIALSEPVNRSKKPALGAGFRLDGASRTRTGDLLGAIQKRDIGKPPPEAGFRLVQRLETPRIPRTYPRVLGMESAPSPKTSSSVPLQNVSRASRLSGHAGHDSRGRGLVIATAHPHSAAIQQPHPLAGGGRRRRACRNRRRKARRGGQGGPAWKRTPATRATERSGAPRGGARAAAGRWRPRPPSSGRQRTMCRPRSHPTR